MKTIHDYFTYLAENELPFIPEMFNNRTYLAMYFSNQRIFETRYKNLYNGLILESEDFELIEDVIKVSVLTKEYKWEKLYNTTQLTYNPIWNVEGTEKTTSVYGEHVTTNSQGERKEIAETGVKRSTNTLDDYSVPYDTGTKTQTGQENNELTQDATTDNVTKQATNDTQTSNAHTDTITLERKGNIGVTSTQKLITEERAVAMFVFYDVVFRDIINDITIPIWK